MTHVVRPAIYPTTHPPTSTKTLSGFHTYPPTQVFTNPLPLPLAMEPVGHCGFQWVSVGSDDILGSLAGFVWADIHQSVFIENIAYSQARLVLGALGISFNKTLYIVLASSCKKLQAILSSPSGTSATIIMASSGSQNAPILDYDAFPWFHFSGFTISQRSGRTRKWMWKWGYDIEKSTTQKRRWVCYLCSKKKSPRAPYNCADEGIHNARDHLWIDHSVWDPTETAPKPLKKGWRDKRSEGNMNIAEAMKLNTQDPREQIIANKIIGRFDKVVFQQKLLSWLIIDNYPFTAVESPGLRDIFIYLNPLVESTKANISRTTIHNHALAAYEEKKPEVVQLLSKVKGKIHVAFDGWRSGNRLSLYGIVIFFLDDDDRLQKLVLDLPEVSQRHTGENIAAHVYAVLDTFGIQERIGYFTLDNAGPETLDKAYC